MGADGGGDPVEGAWEELHGEDGTKVAPGDGGEGGDGGVADAVRGDGGEEGDENVDKENQVAGEVGCEHVGAGTRRAEREAVGECPELVGERQEHDQAPAVNQRGLRINCLGNNATRCVGFGKIEVHLKQALGFELFFSPFGLFGGGNEDWISAALLICCAGSAPC